MAQRGDDRIVARLVSDPKLARIVIVFPPGTKPPQEGEKLSRTEARPFQIMDIRRGGDDMVTIYAREITSPE